MTSIPDMGTILLGKYRLERVLGEGGMGVVARAHHLQLDEPVAIKFLLPELLSKHDVVQRFLREAQASVKLKSEHVARVIDVGSLDTGAPYMVMELLEGGDLGATLKHHGTLWPAMAVDVALQACDALAEAHAIGIVHRDIKPSNLFLSRRRDGSLLVKVLDFGISKAQVHVDAGLTKTQSVMGTPAYMSPEQMRSTRTVDRRSDIWSLGVVLYEVLGGRRPFEGEAYSELCIKVATEPPEPLAVPLPPGLDAVLDRCLQKDPARRFQSIAELAAALAPFATDPHQAQAIAERCARTLGERLPNQTVAMLGGGGPYTPMTPRTPITPMPPPPLATPATPQPTSVTGAAAQVYTGGVPRASSRRGWVIAAIVAFFVAGGTIALILSQQKGGEPAAAPEETPAATPDAAAAAAAAAAPMPAPDAGVAAAAAPTLAVDAAVMLAPDAAAEVAREEPRPEPERRRKPKERRKKPRGDGKGTDDLFDSRE